MASSPQVFQSTNPGVAAAVGENLDTVKGGDGVFGIGHGPNGRGVVGISEQQNGVTGIATKSGGTGVWGDSEQGNGVFGESKTTAGTGVIGQNLTGGRGVLGITANNGDAIFGDARGPTAGGSGRGAVGMSDKGTGVEGHSNAGAGVWGSSLNGEGIHGESQSMTLAAISGIQTQAASTGAGIYGEHAGTGPAGFFKGNVAVTGDLTVSGDIKLVNADCAEDFTVADGELIEPGTVVVICGDGNIAASSIAFDTRVIGVISGAGSFRPGIVLGKQDKAGIRQPVALLGKVYCKADATYGAIAAGDLLTTSPTGGHVMKVPNPSAALGAIMGKSLGRLERGTGLIPLLIALQ